MRLCRMQETKHRIHNLAKAVINYTNSFCEVFAL